MHSPVSRIAIIGGGLMGCGIALVFAQQGCQVTINDVAERRDPAFALLSDNLRQLGRGVQDIAATMDRIRFSADLAHSVEGAEMVVECVPEQLELKQRLFQQLDALCPPPTLLASNTSVISIGEIARLVRHKQRVLGCHFWNPAFLMPLVEVIRTEWTDEALFERTVAILRQVGKHPVRVQKDVPGFLVNRLQHALWREAIYLVEAGIADAATVDEGIRYGFGLRLPTLGPLENADMVGTDLTLAIHEYLFPHLNNATAPSPLLRQLVAEGRLGFKSGAGFRQWNEPAINASRQRLLSYLRDLNHTSVEE